MSTPPVTAPSGAPAPQSVPTPAPAPEAKKWAGKYESPDALEKAHLEAQATLTKQATELAAFKKSAAPEAADKPNSSPAPAADAPPSDLYSKLVTEFRANGGKISDQSKQAAAKLLGADVSLISDIEATIKAKADAGLVKLNGELKTAGVSLTAEQIEVEAHKYLNPQQLKAVQDGINAGLTGAFIDAARIIQGKVSSEPKPAQVGTVGESGGGAGGFSSIEELNTAMTNKNTWLSPATKTALEARYKATARHILDAWERA